MFQHFQTLLEGANPDAHIRFALLSAAERDQLFGMESTQCNYSDNLCHQLFEAQAETPDAIAVAFGDEQLTYLGIDQRANKMAHYLQHWALLLKF